MVLGLLTETMGLFIAMYQSIFFSNCRWALQAQIIGGERGDRASFFAGGRLGNYWAGIKDATQNHLVMRNAAVHKLLSLGKQQLYVL